MEGMEEGAPGAEYRGRHPSSSGSRAPGAKHQRAIEVIRGEEKFRLTAVGNWIHKSLITVINLVLKRKN